MPHRDVHKFRVFRDRLVTAKPEHGRGPSGTGNLLPTGSQPRTSLVARLSDNYGDLDRDGTRLRGLLAGFCHTAHSTPPRQLPLARPIVTTPETQKERRAA